MAKCLEIYECESCGNLVEVFRGAGGVLVCCDQNMKLLEEKTADSSTEKHVPVVEKTDKGYKVVVGSTIHPMTDEHYIEWIELVQGSKVMRKHLNPGDAPEAHFQTCMNCDEPVTVREHCNVHGLWKS